MSADTLTLKQLRAFKAYIDHGSVVAAAESLNLTPPAVTIQIKAMERAFGAKLYRRVDKTIQLTDHGNRILKLATKIQNEIAHTVRDLDDIKSARRGRVRLGITTSAKYFIPKVVAGFKDNNADIEIHLSVDNSNTVMEALEAGQLDLVVTGSPRGDFAQGSTHICDHPYVMIASPKHPMVAMKNIVLSDLADEEFLVREKGSGSRALMESIFARGGLSAHRFSLVARTNETIKQGVIAGLGIAFISSQAVASEVSAGELAVLDIVDFPITRGWYVVQNPNFEMSASSIALRNFIQHEAPLRVPQLV